MAFLYEEQGMLHEMFVRQALRTPERTAIVCAGGRSITFRDLNSITDTLAHWLRLQGTRPDSIVGIYMEKGLEYCIAYIAILKAGE